MTSYPPPPPSTPPPPPLGAFEQQDVPTPPVAWLVPLAALLAVVGAFTPWFHGSASVPGHGSQSFKDALYSYEDGRLGLLAPIALVVLSIGIIGLLRGKTPRRFSRGSAGPVVSAARGAMIIGAVTLVCVVIAWFLVPSQYKFDDGSGRKVSWNSALDELHSHGVNASFSRGPQVGYFLTIAAGVLALIAGGLMLLTRSKTVGDQPAPSTAYPPPSGYAPAFPPPGPQQSYGAPQQSYGAPQQSYGAPQQSYGPPASSSPPSPQGQPTGGQHPGFGPASTYGAPAGQPPAGPPDLTK